MGGGRGKGARVLMTFSLWNLVSIVSVVNILPKDSTCHHGHTGSELLNAHRWYYTLCAHADDLIPVSLRCFFFCHMPVSADDLLPTGASLCSAFQDVIRTTFMPASSSWSISTLGASSRRGSGRSSRPSRVHVGTRAFLREGELFAVVSRDCEHMVSNPRKWKKLHFQQLAAPSNLFYGQFQSARSQTNTEEYMVRVWGQKQRHGDGHSIRCVGREGWEVSQ